MKAFAPTAFQNVRYEFKLERNGRTVATKRGSSPQVRFTVSGSGYTIRYRVSVPNGATSKFSNGAKVPK